MYTKHLEGVKQGKRYGFFDVDADQCRFNFRSIDQKATMFPTVFTSKAEVEGGDMHHHSWDKHDNEFIHCFMIFASLRNGELDAYTLDEKMVMLRKKFLNLMIICTRGGFLKDIPGIDDSGFLMMPWFQERQFSFFAVYLAHVIELRLWKEFWSRPINIHGDAKIPRDRYTITKVSNEVRIRRKLANEAFEKEIKVLRNNKESNTCPSPIARASENDLIKHFLNLTGEEKMKILCGHLKDEICKLCHRRVENKDKPITLPPPFLEPL